VTKPVYDNKEGYTDDGRRIASTVSQFVTSLMEGHPNISSLEIVALVNMGASEAHNRVSLKRRFGM